MTQDPSAWLNQVLSKEVPKLAKLVDSGATRYILVTNMPGSAHPDVGSIDRLQKALQERCPVPAKCWWRDDLNRRLDAAWDLKWAYPDLMTGPDLIRSIVESGLSEDRERRSNAIRAFVRNQYAQDETVKFKQVDLQNKLLDLFVDVPLKPPAVAANRRQLRRIQHLHVMLEREFARQSTDAPQSDTATSDYVDIFGYEGGEPPQIGAATFLLSDRGQANAPRVVIEGAPGQGKSTIAQYVCQVHRGRILDRKDEMATLPPPHQRGAVRLPIKVDLRDFAAWIAGRNPFGAEADASAPPTATRSLEGFIAALIEANSGGMAFDVADLASVLRVSAVLLALDGLDEVADIERRSAVVDQIVRGVDRLEEHASSLQVIVTSRPAAFANSPGLPEDKYPYYQLSALSRELVDEYANKWLRARRLAPREAADVRAILRDRLDQPHLRDLAHNPMQLAILLSLIHTRGSSLPDKRTALYDSYVELFFSRESEKSSIVRAHRDLLINIHRYLGWLLHSQAEVGGTSGAIAEDNLQACVREYLAREGHDPALASKLFAGMVERVVALVSRVQGTYEFEVQPLREYFAARHLYETAPYSPTGREARGTMPDRFDALARNFYWLNVTRFYAGCYSKGELASLIESLRDLMRDERFSVTAHPRQLAAALLADWVFSQHPRSVREVVDLILDGIGLRYFLAAAVRGRASTSAIPALPDQCGRAELFHAALERLAESPPGDYARDLIELIRLNSTGQDLMRLWKENHKSLRRLNQRWFCEVAFRTGMFAMFEETDLVHLLRESKAATTYWYALRSGRAAVLESHADLMEAAVDFILSGDMPFDFRRRARSYLEILAAVVRPDRYMRVGLQGSAEPFDPGKAEVKGQPELPVASQTAVPALVESIARVNEIWDTWRRRPTGEWSQKLDPWDAIVEGLRSEFGDRWVTSVIANTAAGIRSQEELCSDHAALHDTRLSLCRRVRYARLRAGNDGWWARQLDSAETGHDLLTALLVVGTWGSPRTLARLTGHLEERLAGLGRQEWRRLMEAMSQAGFNWLTYRRVHSRANDVGIPHGCSQRVAAFLALRPELAVPVEAVTSYTRSSDPWCAGIVQLAAARYIIDGTLGWEEGLQVIRATYEDGASSEQFGIHGVWRRDPLEMPLDHAVHVASNAEKYPGFIVAMAENRCTAAARSNVVPITTVAEQGGWW